MPWLSLFVSRRVSAEAARELPIGERGRQLERAACLLLLMSFPRRAGSLSYEAVARSVAHSESGLGYESDL